MREYNPFSNLEEVKRSGLSGDLLPNDEEIVATNKNRFILPEEVPDNGHDPLELLILKEEGKIIEDELEANFEDTLTLDEYGEVAELSDEELKRFYEL